MAIYHTGTLQTTEKCNNDK